MTANQLTQVEENALNTIVSNTQNQMNEPIYPAFHEAIISLNDSIQGLPNEQNALPFLACLHNELWAISKYILCSDVSADVSGRSKSYEEFLLQEATKNALSREFIYLMNCLQMKAAIIEKTGEIYGKVN